MFNLFLLHNLALSAPEGSDQRFRLMCAWIAARCPPPSVLIAFSHHFDVVTL